MHLYFSSHKRLSLWVFWCTYIQNVYKFSYIKKQRKQMIPTIIRTKKWIQIDNKKNKKRKSKPTETTECVLKGLFKFKCAFALMHTLLCIRKLMLQALKKRLIMIWTNNLQFLAKSSFSLTRHQHISRICYSFIYFFCL